MNSEEMRRNFESWKKLKVAVLTWNLAGKGAPPNFDASRVLLPDTIQQEISLFGNENAP